MKTYDDGRKEQFETMMEQLAALQAKYKGVRGELLAKVKEELAKLEPTRAAPNKPTAAPAAKPAATPAPAKPASTATATKAAPVPAANSTPPRVPTQKMLPSCRLCGRGMKVNDAGALVCAAGHTRAAA